MSERKKFRIQRSLGVELLGLGKPGALERRNYPPGQHGRLHKRKITLFGSDRDNRYWTTCAHRYPYYSRCESHLIYKHYF